MTTSMRFPELSVVSVITVGLTPADEGGRVIVPPTERVELEMMKCEAESAVIAEEPIVSTATDDGAATAAVVGVCVSPFTTTSEPL